MNLLMSVRLRETAVNVFVRRCFSRRIFLLRLFPLLFGSFEILHYRYWSFWRFRFPFRFLEFPNFLLRYLPECDGWVSFCHHRCFWAWLQHLSLSVRLFDHMASFVAILDVFYCNSDEPSVWTLRCMARTVHPVEKDSQNITSWHKTLSASAIKVIKFQDAA